LLLFLYRRKALSVFVKPIQEEYGWKTSQLAVLYSACFGFQAAGYYLSERLCSRFGTKDTALIGTSMLGSGCLASAACVALLKKKAWLPLLLTYSALGSLGNGMIENTAFTHISENAEETPALALSMYLVAVSAAPLYMAPGWSLLFRKTKSVPLVLALTAGLFSSHVPFLQLWKRRDTSFEDKAKAEQSVRFVQFVRRFLFEPRFFTYASMLFVLSVGRAVLYAFAASIFEETKMFSPLTQSLLTGLAGFLPTLARILAVWKLPPPNTPLLGLVLRFVGLQLTALYALRNTQRPLVFLLGLVLFLTSGGLVHSARLLVAADDQLSPEERKSHTEFQTVLAVFSATLFPPLFALLQEMTGSFRRPLGLLMATNIYLLLVAVIRCRKEFKTMR
jgi:MFS family permease